jgi:hypothetical protein
MIGILRKVSINLQDRCFMKNSTLTWLQEWYADHSRGREVEGNGILIQTLEKPEWLIKINLSFSFLNSKQFEDITIQRSIHDWLICKVQDNYFHGNCSLQNLIEVIDIFRDWTLEKGHIIWQKKVTVEKAPNFKMLSLFLFREDEAKH